MMIILQSRTFEKQRIGENVTNRIQVGIHLMKTMSIVELNRYSQNYSLRTTPLNQGGYAILAYHRLPMNYKGFKHTLLISYRVIQKQF